MNGTSRALYAVMLGCCVQLTAKSSMAQSTEVVSKVSQSDDSHDDAPVKMEHSEGAKQDRVPFTVRIATPGMRFDVLTESDDIVENCVQTCQLDLPKGHYKVRELDAKGRESRTVDFVVYRAGSIEIENPNRQVAITGLVLGITGAVMIPVGSALLLSGLCMDNCAGRTDLSTVGAGMIVAGLVLAPVGWIMFGINHGAKVNYLGPRDVRLALVPTRDGASLGITGRF